MNCLCCGKKINDEKNAIENSYWHKSCIKKFFGTTVLPEISLNEEVLNEIVKANVACGLNVTGIQKKLSLHLSKDIGSTPRLTLTNYPTGYILKPQAPNYKNLPENEYLIMSMARECGIKTVPFALIKSKDDLNYAYITKRIDRNIIKDEVNKYAMEDFCQLSERITEDKYNSSYEQCAKIINKYSRDKGLDLAEFFYRCIFNFVVGNTDMHLKNFSLIEIIPMSRKFVLSPAYDLLSTKLVLPEDDEETALTICGRKKNITRNTWLKFADCISLDKKIALNLINKLISYKPQFLSMIEESYLSHEQKQIIYSIVNVNINKF